jgi:hypothetical protein
MRSDACNGAEASGWSSTEPSAARLEVAFTDVSPWRSGIRAVENSRSVAVPSSLATARCRRHGARLGHRQSPALARGHARLGAGHYSGRGGAPGGPRGYRGCGHTGASRLPPGRLAGDHGGLAGQGTREGTESEATWPSRGHMPASNVVCKISGSRCATGRVAAAASMSGVALATSVTHDISDRFDPECGPVDQPSPVGDEPPR